jgi:hypothetical protein
MTPVRLQRVIVGVDGTADGQRPLSWAATIATATDAEVVAVRRPTVGPPSPPPGGRVSGR